MRGGFTTIFHPSPSSDRSACYVAQSYRNGLNMGDRFNIFAYGRPPEWHGGEGTHRWTTAEEGVLPFRPNGDFVIVDLVNYRGEPIRFKVETTQSFSGIQQHGEARTILLPAAERIICRSSLS